MHPHDTLESRTIGTYLDALASSAPAPGGGSVAGLVGALAAGLAQMVISLTTDVDGLAETANELASLRASSLASGEADELAYSGYLEATKMPKSTPEEKDRRRETMQGTIRHAAEVPLELAATGVRMLEHLAPVVERGNPHVLSDAEIAITLAVACVDASLVNVRINLPLIRDAEAAGAIRDKARQLERHAHHLADQLRTDLATRRSKR
jgi:methenyltetrahydrofolate cyclohydrolase